MKTCSKCKEEKDRSAFNKQSSAKDGLQSRCRDCTKNGGREYHATNRDAILPRLRDNYYANIDARREYHAQYRLDNANKRSEAFKAYYAENKDALNSKTKEWRKANPEVVQRHRAEYRAREMGAYVEGAYIPTYEELVTFYGKPCLYPGCENTDTTYDHIVAYANGGLNKLSNLQPMCKSHNSAKRDHHDTDYRTGDQWVDRINGIDVIYRPYK